MPDCPDKSTGSQIPTNLRLLILLEEIVRQGVPVKPMWLVEKLGLPKPTVHRLLQTAEAEGFLQRDIDGRSFGAGPRLRKLSVMTLSSEHLRTARVAVMRRVAHEIGETCNLATPDREGMTYLDRVETKWPLRIQIPRGYQVPFHCTASGKMYLSTLRDNIRDALIQSSQLEARTDKTLTTPNALKVELEVTHQRGYALDEEEYMSGMIAIAVPVNDDVGRLMATLSIHAPKIRCSIDDLVDFLPVLRDGAQALAELQNV